MIKEYLKCNSDRSENADQLLFVGSENGDAVRLLVTGIWPSSSPRMNLENALQCPQWWTEGSNSAK